MFTLTHQIDGVEVYRKTLPRGSLEDTLEASQEFHSLVHSTTEEYPFSREGVSEDVLMDPVISNDLIDHYENTGRPLHLKDDDGKVHTFTFIRD